MSFLGERFKREREARGIAILQIEIDTRIRTNIIQAIEDGNYASLPPAPFLRGLIRSYSNYLGIDPQEMLELYVADTQPIQPSQVRPIQTPSVTPSPPPSIPQQPLVPMPPATPSVLPPKPLPTIAHKPSETNGTPQEPGQPAFVAPTRQIIEEPKPIEPITPSELAASTAPSFLPEPVVVPMTSDMPPPDMPPEMLPPPEHIEHPNQTQPQSEVQEFVAYVMQRGLPIPVFALVILAAILSCVAITMLVATQVGPIAQMIQSAPSATPTRAPATATRPIVPGSAPTSIPTLAVTAAPFPTFPGNPTATGAAPRRTLETVSGLNLDIDVGTESVNVQIGVDGVMAFSGTLASGVSKSWTARDTLYMRIENSKNATIKFNGKQVLPNVFAERTLMERQWTYNERGVPVLETPMPPAAPVVKTPQP